MEPASECPTRTCLETGEVQSQIFSRSSDRGDTVWEEVRSSPIFDDSGKIVHVVEVWRDISERLRAEARIAESHRLASLGLLASGFSHELNTPLATVLACVEGILRMAEKAHEGGGENCWKQIDRNARIAREQLLRCRLTTQHFLRLASGKGAASELIDVAATVSAVARLSEPTAKARGVAIRVAPPVDGAQVRGNHADFQHILLNLILNAIEVSVPGGEVRLAADGHDPVHIRVSDDGPGIAPEDQKRIFEPISPLPVRF